MRNRHFSCASRCTKALNTLVPLVVSLVLLLMIFQTGSVLAAGSGEPGRGNNPGTAQSPISGKIHAEASAVSNEREIQSDENALARSAALSTP